MLQMQLLQTDQPAHGIGKVNTTIRPLTPVVKREGGQRSEAANLLWHGEILRLQLALELPQPHAALQHSAQVRLADIVAVVAAVQGSEV